MLDTAIPVKTASGRTEISERRHKLGARQRVLLISINGEHSVREIRQQFQALGDIDALLAELVSAELIAVATSPSAAARAPPAAPAAATEAEVPATSVARQFMNESVVAQLGLRAFLFTLKIERCYTRQELLDLLPEYRRLLGKSLDAVAVAAFSERAEALIGKIDPL